MKEFKKITILGVIMTLAFTALCTVNSMAGMQKRAPLKAKIVFPKDADRDYNLDNPKDAISMDLLLKNVSGSAVWTEEGFDDQNFHVFFFIYGPLGKDARLITSAGRAPGLSFSARSRRALAQKVWMRPWLIPPRRSSSIPVSRYPEAASRSFHSHSTRLNQADT